MKQLLDHRPAHEQAQRRARAERICRAHIADLAAQPASEATLRTSPTESESR